MRSNHANRRPHKASAPPPYATAVYRRLWAVVAPYVDESDLYAACLTCQQWHQIFSPYLWGNPATRFGTDNDTVYLSITRFKRLLPHVRPNVRNLTHTLHLPPAQPEFYGGPQAGWLRNIMDYLPSLRALIVSRLSFFDHQALQPFSSGSHQKHRTKYDLRLLIASYCENTTPGSLATSLSYFPDLVYLDLSATQGTRNPLVLAEVGRFSQLAILRMQNCGLKDGDIQLLTFSTRLRSLDLSDNNLTAIGVVDIVERLPQLRQRADYFSHNAAGRFFQRPTLQSLAAEKLMSGQDGHITLEDHLPTSFTELFLAGNLISLEELTSIFTYPNLNTLDIGSMYCSRQPAELWSPETPIADRRRLSSLRVDQLGPALFTKAFLNVRSLRLHHSVITSQPFGGKELPVAEQCFELHDQDLRYELDSTEVVPVFELDDTSVNVAPSVDSQTEVTTDHTEPSADSVSDLSEGHPTFETPDDVGADLSPSPSVKVRNSMHSGNDYQPENATTSSRRMVPPEIALSHSNRTPLVLLQAKHVVPNVSPNHQHPPSYTSAPNSADFGTQMHLPSSSLARDGPGISTTIDKNGLTATKHVIEQIIERRHRIAMRERYPGRFTPAMLPNLEILTLTDVPSTTRRQDVIDSLRTFIQECAEEEELASLECLELRERNGEHTGKYSTNGLFKLKRLVLEMSPAPDPIEPPHSPRDRSHRLSFTKSSTEDPDSEMFMEASESDFSFFREDDGGLLVSEGKIDSPTAVNDGMIHIGSPTANGHSVDVVSEVASFRREKKMFYEAAVRVGKPKVDTALLGNWKGEIKVIRDFA